MCQVEMIAILQKRYFIHFLLPLPGSMGNVVTNILVYYMSSYVHYYLKKITVIAFFKVK